MAIAPPIRTISAATLAKARPAIEMLMSEHNLTAESALNVAMDPAKLRRYVDVQLSEAQRHARKMNPIKASDNARSAPGSSIGKDRGVREPADPPMVERKPGESLKDWIRRTGEQIANLGKPGASLGQAAQTGGKAVPQGSDPTPANDSFGERSETGNAARKQRALNDPVERKARMAEYGMRAGQPWGGLSPDPASTSDLARFANEYAADNHVDYKTALKEVGRRPAEKWRSH